MSKLAYKVPATVRTVVSIQKDLAEVWYSKPMSLGRIEYRDGYWFSVDGMRFMSSRDAMEYLIRMYELRTNGTSPEPIVQGRAIAVPVEAQDQASPKRSTDSPMRTKIVRKKTGIQDPFVSELLQYLRSHPEVQKLVHSGTGTTKPGSSGPKKE